MDACGEASGQSFQQRYHAEEVEERFGRFKPGVIRYHCCLTLGVIFICLQHQTVLGIARIEACLTHLYRVHPFILTHLSKACHVLAMYQIYFMLCSMGHRCFSHACDPRAWEVEAGQTL